MPENLTFQKIPTIEELKLRQQEQPDHYRPTPIAEDLTPRLRGRTLVGLETQGQRLDYMNEAMDEAIKVNTLIDEARALLEPNSSLSPEERNELNTLAAEAATRFQALKNKVTELQQKYSTPAESEQPQQQTAETSTATTAQETAEAAAEKLPETLQSIVDVVNAAAQTEAEKQIAQETQVNLTNWLADWKNFIEARAAERVTPPDISDIVENARVKHTAPSFVSSREASGRYSIDYPSFQLLVGNTDGSENISQEFFTRVIQELGCVPQGQTAEAFRSLPQYEQTANYQRGREAAYNDSQYAFADRVPTKIPGIDAKIFYRDTDRRVFLNLDISTFSQVIKGE